ncbi:MAG: DMT family transporter [Candidatus Woesearchaeota archaeon]
MDNKKIGVIVILLASIMWALEPIFAKLSYANASFIQTFTIRAIVVALVAVIYALFTKANFKVAKKHVPKILYVALAGTIFADLLYFYALTKVPVINAVLIGHMQPIFIILIGFFILKEDRLTKYDYIGICIMIFAGLLVTTRNFQNLSMFKFGTLADLLILFATLAWATTAIVTRKYLGTVNSGVLAFYRFSISAIIFVMYLFIKSSIAFPSLYQIILGVVVGIGTILYYEGLKRIKAAQVAAIELSTPFFAIILGLFVLSEMVTMMQILGVFFLVVGIYFLSKKE